MYLVFHQQNQEVEVKLGIGESYSPDSDTAVILDKINELKETTQKIIDTELKPRTDVIAALVDAFNIKHNPDLAKQREEAKKKKGL